MTKESDACGPRTNLPPAGNAKHEIGESDLVVLRERVSNWPVGTKGTAVSIYDDAALVEISEDTPPGRALDMLVVPPIGST
jgi:hypothetical protein